MDMGLEPFLVASALNIIIAQRLVRKICPHCITSTTYLETALVEAGLDPGELDGDRFFKGAGCPECNNTGYKGRAGLFEVMAVTPKIREMIVQKSSSAVIKKQACEEGMLTLRENGLVKFREGVSTLEEVLKETSMS